MRDRAMKGFYFKRRALNSAMLLLADGLAIVAALVSADLLVYRAVALCYSLLLVPAWWGTSLFSDLVPGWGRSRAEELRQVEMLVVLLFGVAAAGALYGRLTDAASRNGYIAVFLLCAMLIPIMRTLGRSLLVRLGAWGAPTVLYVDKETAGPLVNTLREGREIGYDPVAILADDLPVGTSISGVPVLGRFDDPPPLTAIAFLALGSGDASEERLLVDGPLRIFRSVVLVRELAEAQTLWVAPRDLRGVLGLEIQANLLDPFSQHLKYWSERLTVLLLSPIWGALGLLLALAVWLEDRSPPFFVQDRVGRDGRRFRMYKFRTMRPGADQALTSQLEADALLRQEWDGGFKLKRDPRVTRVGRVLRILSLDELPQLFNVLRGEMSLVGPRPLPPYHHDHLPDKVRRLRERVLPGLTGLWQVSGRSETGPDGMEKWDLYYVRNWSIWLDLVILGRTLRAVLTCRGAY